MQEEYVPALYIVIDGNGKKDEAVRKQVHVAA
jgi:hypothetical protein